MSVFHIGDVLANVAISLDQIRHIARRSELPPLVSEGGASGSDSAPLAVVPGASVDAANPANKWVKPDETKTEWMTIDLDPPGRLDRRAIG